MSKFTKGQRVFRYYTCEPSFIYGSGRQKEEGEVIGEPIEFEGRKWVPVKWLYEYRRNGHPSLDLESSIFPMGETSSE